MQKTGKVAALFLLFLYFFFHVSSADFLFAGTSEIAGKNYIILRSRYLEWAKGALKPKSTSGRALKEYLIYKMKWLH